MEYHFFSDKLYAGPTSLDVLRFWDSGGYTLREKSRLTLPKMRFPDSDELIKYEIARIGDSADISDFWNRYYSGSDWLFSCQKTDVERWIKSGFILIIKHDESIVGTFVCHYLPGLYSGNYNNQAALLDGLVIHPKFRKMGLASFLLVCMDYHIYTINKMEKALLIWLREHSTRISAYTQSPISVLEYFYAKIHELPNRSLIAVKASDIDVERIVKSLFSSEKYDFTLALDYLKDTDIYWFLYKNSLIGIANTHRITKIDKCAILEVVFACNLEKPFFSDLQIPIEVAARELAKQPNYENAIIFMTNSKSRGNCLNPCNPWVKGKSGFLTTHVYNWMPPTFFIGDIFLPISCI
jgi:GNAT superfamily N-acetyltransferase